MKKLLAIISFLILTFAAYKFFAHRQSNPSQQKPTVKIGMSLPLTGNLAQIGNAIKDVIALAKNEIPSDSKYNYEFFIEDDGYEPRRMALMNNLMISTHKVDALFTIWGTAANITAPLAEKNKIIHINCGWGGDIYGQFKYSFHHSPSTRSQAKALTTLLRDKNIKTISIVSINYALFDEIMKYVRPNFAEAGIKILSTDLVNMKTYDYRMIIAKLKETNPDIILILLDKPELGAFGKQAAEMKLNKPFTSIDVIIEAENLSLYEGSEFIMAPIGSPEFITKFKKISDNNIEVCLANFYDMVKIIYNTYEQFDDKPTPEQIVDALHQIKNYDSPVGAKLTVDQNGNIDSDLIRAKIQNGQIDGIRD